MHPFSTPWQQQKILQFSNVFSEGLDKGYIGNKCVKHLSKEEFINLNNKQTKFVKIASTYSI